MGRSLRRSGHAGDDVGRRAVVTGLLGVAIEARGAMAQNHGGRCGPSGSGGGNGGDRGSDCPGNGNGIGIAERKGSPNDGGIRILIQDLHNNQSFFNR